MQHDLSSRRIVPVSSQRLDAVANLLPEIRFSCRSSLELG